jgi:hypothetical protein
MLASAGVNLDARLRDLLKQASKHACNIIPSIIDPFFSYSSSPQDYPIGKQQQRLIAFRCQR